MQAFFVESTFPKGEGNLWSSRALPDKSEFPEPRLHRQLRALVGPYPVQQGRGGLTGGGCRENES